MIFPGPPEPIRQPFRFNHTMNPVASIHARQAANIANRWPKASRRHRRAGARWWWRNCVRWPTEAAALAVCDELASYAGFDRSRLRVVPVHTMTNQLCRAYYSPSAAKLCGSNFYRGSDGSEIEVTNVEESLDSTGTYGWPDAVPIGPVTEWIRQGQAGRDSLSCLE